MQFYLRNFDLLIYFSVSPHLLIPPPNPDCLRTLNTLPPPPLQSPHCTPLPPHPQHLAPPLKTHTHTHTTHTHLVTQAKLAVGLLRCLPYFTSLPHCRCRTNATETKVLSAELFCKNSVIIERSEFERKRARARVCVCVCVCARARACVKKREGLATPQVAGREDAGWTTSKSGRPCP